MLKSFLFVFFMTVMFDIYAQDGILPAIHTFTDKGDFFKNEPPRGMRFLFDSTWAKGEVLSANNTSIQNDSFLFNFDKVTQNLFLFENDKDIVEIDKKEFKSVVFYHHDSAYFFEHVYFIDNSDLFQVIVQTKDKYSLYKLIHTVLKKADYYSNGLRESGSKYDRWVDVPEYFILFPNRDYRRLYSLKKKSIDGVFSLSPDNEKVNGYFTLHKKDKAGEENLKNLILYLNNN